MIKELRIPYRSFKPYYNWIIFNTNEVYWPFVLTICGFKPYYNWIIFNTSREGVRNMHGGTVLNLIITGLSSIHQTGR